MIERIKKEIELLQRKYGKLGHGPNYEWLCFSKFKLPPGWNRDETELLVPIPQGYASAAPNCFCVTIGLRTASGSQPGNYSEGANYDGKQWGQFSFRPETWNPSDNITDGDNLLTYMIGVEKRLREIN